jgi:hypothetical protein
MHRIKTLTNRVARDPLAAQEVPAADLETDQATVLGHHWSSREGTRLAWPAEVAVTRYRYRGHRIPSPWTATGTGQATTRPETPLPSSAASRSAIARPAESRMRGNSHVRFGGRDGETDRRQRCHRAPSRPCEVMPRLLYPSWRWMTIRGTPSWAISTAWACRSWCGAKRRRTPACAAVRRRSARAAVLDQVRPRVGPLMTQKSGPTGSSSRTSSQGCRCSQAHPSMPTSRRRPPSPRRTSTEPRHRSRSGSLSASASWMRSPARQRRR